MSSNILKIKNIIPPLRANIMPRTHITKSLDENLCVLEGFTRQLTLISASAGFGKTTLVRNWLAGRENQVAWFSIDERDNDSERFWVYLISALQAVNNSVGNTLLEILRSKSILSETPQEADALLTALLNDLLILKEPVYLVLDDYHIIKNANIHQDMGFFIENLPPTLHVIVTTRLDPPWALTRWRAKAQMLEIRAKDLKFSEQEAYDLFEKLNGNALNETHIHTLYNKTEGWITGLYLAAFSISASNDVDNFIKNFAGSHKHILNFLSEEIFNQQPENVQDFLLKTSVLSRLCAPLCDAVTDRNDSHDILSHLEHQNLFVISLDDEGVWYRYHHLFSDLLSYYLKKRSSEMIDTLHEKAEKWFLASGEPSEAVYQALKSENFEKAAAIIHDYYQEIMQTEGPRLMIGCLKSFSTPILKKYPRLLVNKALYTLIHNGIEEVESYLSLLADVGYDNPKDHQEYEGMLAVVKTYYYVNKHDLKNALQYAEKALALLPIQSYYWRMCVSVFMGDVLLLVSNNPKDAYPYYLEAELKNQQLGYHYLHLNVSYKIINNLCCLGKLSDAEVYIQNRRISKSKGTTPLIRGVTRGSNAK